MFRCVTSCVGASISACITAVLCLAVSAPACAQNPTALPYLTRHFTANALRGEMVFLNSPEVQINGHATRLSPGSRIRNQQNLMVLPGSLAGQKWRVNYTLDDVSGQIKDVWILDPAEAKKDPWPQTLQEAGSWRFDFASQRWVKP